MSIGCRTLLRRLDRKFCIYVICVLLPFILSPLAASSHKESRCGYVMLLVAAYWLFEPVPVAATALIPVVLFPVLGIVSSDQICSNYMKESFMMFIGGLIVAIAVEDCNLHERIALKVLLWVGTEIKWLMMGFMIITMFLSMWVSNTATTAMMVPIVEAIIEKISSKEEENDIEMETKNNSLTESKQVDPELNDGSHKANGDVSRSNSESSLSTIKTALLLSVCYAANIGGTGTLTGTGTNLVLKIQMDGLYPESDDITFVSWMIYNVPGMIICVLIGWVYLWLIYIRFSKRSQNLQSSENIKEIISKRYADLGPMSWHEIQVFILFLILVSLWIFRDPKFISGWAYAINSDVKIGDSVPAIAVAFLMFFFPADPRDFGGRPILDWKTAQAKLPWGVIILIGGGFAMADAAQQSGLSSLLGQQLSPLSVLPPGAIVAVICFMTAMLTEFVTNTITATILLPVFNEMAISIGVNPLFLMLPVAVVCSYAFMLPVATPPNAIAFESGKMRAVDMAKPGLVMNIVCCAVQLLMINTLGVMMFDLHNLPYWAIKKDSISFNSTTMTYQNMTLSNI